VADLKLSVLSPDRRVINEVTAAEVTLTTSEGQIQILPGHAPMVSTLDAGGFRYTPTQGDRITGAISWGFVEVYQNLVTVSAQTVEMRDEINLDRAKAAQKKAEEMLNSPNIDESSFRKYQLKLQRSLIRQQIANKDFSF